MFHTLEYWSTAATLSHKPVLRQKHLQSKTPHGVTH